MNNTEKQEFLVELDNSINDLIKSHNKDENFTIISKEIELLVNSIIKNKAKEKSLSYKERLNLYQEMFKKTVDILIHVGFEYKK